MEMPSSSISHNIKIGNIMKRAAGFILCALVVSVVILTAFHLALPKPAIPHTEAVAFPSISVPHQAFLTLCSGLPINDATLRIATANCLGRIRGFSDAHALTVKLAGDAGASIQMWCVGPNVTDKQLLDSVIAWTTNNHDRVAGLTKEYTAVNAATAIIIAALHSTYPCEKP
jgi:hypothetical protein